MELCRFDEGATSPPDTTDPSCFPLQTGSYAIGDDPLDLPYNFGWKFLNLNIPGDEFFTRDARGNTSRDPNEVDFGTDGDIAQSYVTTLHSALGRFSVGLQAVELYDACQDVNPRIDGVIPQF